MTIGQRGERIAARYLMQQGYRVLVRGWHGGGCEIDLIALDGDEVVFVEVKTRRNIAMGFPEQAVGTAKLRHIERGAQAWLLAHDPKTRWRVDVVSILYRDGTPHLTHFRGIGYA